MAQTTTTTTTPAPALTAAEVKAIGTIRLCADWRTLILPALVKRETSQTTAIRKAEEAIGYASADWATERAAYDSVNRAQLETVAAKAKVMAQKIAAADDAMRALNAAMVAGESTPEQLAELRAAQMAAFRERAAASIAHADAKAEIKVADPGTLDQFTERAVQTYMDALEMMTKIQAIRAKVESVTPARIDEQIVKTWVHAKLGINLSAIKR